MKINMRYVSLPCIHDEKSDKARLRVFGTCLLEPPALSNISLDTLNLDGEYLAVYENTKDDTAILFRSHVDSFGIYYILENNELVISNELFALVKIQKILTWNRLALSDYFEPGWNNIQKKDRTPFEEIQKLPAGHCLNYSAKGLYIKRWNIINKDKKYSMRNLKNFKEAFFKTLENYLRAYISNDSAFTVSGGIDSSSTACFAHKLFPVNKFLYFSTKLDNELEDESKLTRNLEAVLEKEVLFIEPKIPESFIDTLREIQGITQSPYSNIEGMSHIDFFRELQKHNVKKVITGFGADLTFGGTPYEYPRLVDHYLKTFQFKKAKNVYIAFHKGVGNPENPDIAFLGYRRNFFKRPFKKMVYFLKLAVKKIIHYPIKNKTQLTMLNIKIPKFESALIKNYRGGVEYACTDSALRELTALQNHYGIKPQHPFEGFQFAKLAASCDPYIFANGVNKFCNRYAVQGLIPQELLNCEKKEGNGGNSSKKLYSLFKREILTYIEQRKSSGNSIVNINRLITITKEASDFSDEMFRALNILVFEELIMNSFGINISV